MKAGNKIYNSEAFCATNRYEAIELLCELTERLFGSERTRLSNGAVIDAFLLLYDAIVLTPKLKEKLEKFLAGYADSFEEMEQMTK